MNIDSSFFPKDDDENFKSIYPSGKLKESSYLRNGQPANGWSRKLFYEKGALQLQECYSHSIVIEQLGYDEEGNIISHKIYNNRLKQLIVKPVQTVVIPHNTVSGTAHMGFYFKHLPAISKFIGAVYDEVDLDKAYQDFITSPSTYNNIKKADDEWEEENTPWKIQGNNMGFTIAFEHGEGYYQWGLWTKTEEDYERAKGFMDNLEN